jgi:hypothetical protein
MVHYSHQLANTQLSGNIMSYFNKVQERVQKLENTKMQQTVQTGVISAVHTDTAYL